MTKIKRILPLAWGWWGDEDGGVGVRIWSEATPQGTIKISYVSDYEHFEYVPANEVEIYPEGAEV